jgi:hypothetical protein
MLATWQEHRGSHIGVKVTSDSYAPCAILSCGHRCRNSDEVVQAQLTATPTSRNTTADSAATST